MRPQATSIKADEVKIIGEPNEVFEIIRIEARVLHAEDANIEVFDLERNFVCQEVRLLNSRLSNIPSLVEKLVVVDLNLGNIGRCHKLKYIFIDGTTLHPLLEDDIIVPALVKQFGIGVVVGFKASLRWRDIKNCDHVECWSENMTLEQLGLTQLPPSVYFPNLIQRFQPQLVRRREPEPQHRRHDVIE